jgi:hypothetical protein
MVAMMASTLIFTYYFTANLNAILWSGGFMALVAIWAWRYPGSVEEYNLRVKACEKIAWIK